MGVVDASPLRTTVALRDDDESRRAVSTDFGGMVRRVPGAVVTARSPEDVRRTLDFARRARCPGAVRGAGHSRAGKSLTDGGILLDMTSLDRIAEIRDGAVRVQAGATWRKLVHHTRARGCLPAVLTTNLDATIGGTLSMAGFGPFSHRHGAQAGNVDELVVITGDARQLRCSRTENPELSGNVDELVVITGDARQLRCSRTENPELFDCVHCGLGQFAAIVEARVKLRRTLPRARTFHLAYDGIEGLMRNLRQAISDNRFEYIASRCVARVAGLERLLARRLPFAQRRYVMSLTAEFDGDFDADGGFADPMRTAQALQALDMLAFDLDRSARSEVVGTLLETQRGDGSWSPCPAWKEPPGWADYVAANEGVQHALPPRGFASEVLTTAFCIEALERSLAQVRERRLSRHPQGDRCEAHRTRQPDASPRPVESSDSNRRRTACLEPSEPGPGLSSGLTHTGEHQPLAPATACMSCSASAAEGGITKWAVVALSS